MSTPSKILAIVGPTASGKTPLALLLGKQLNGEVISADSRQIYRFMDIGTAKPTAEERLVVPHHLIDLLDPAQEYSAGQFLRDAQEAVRAVQERGRLPMLVGGSGLYVRAFIDGLFAGPGKDPQIREELEEQLRARGAAWLLEELRRIDPVAAASADPTKPRRIIRALEVYRITGQPLSELQRTEHTRPPYGVHQYALEWDRAVLYGIIEERVDRMMESGLLQEVRSLMERGYDLRCNAMNTVGYKELFRHLQSEIDLDEAVALIKRNTKRFAKRQFTWFRADKRIIWKRLRNLDDLGAVADSIVAEFQRN